MESVKWCFSHWAFIVDLLVVLQTAALAYITKRWLGMPKPNDNGEVPTWSRPRRRSGDNGPR